VCVAILTTRNKSLKRVVRVNVRDKLGGTDVDVRLVAVANADGMPHISIVGLADETRDAAAGDTNFLRDVVLTELQGVDTDVWVQASGDVDT